MSAQNNPKQQYSAEQLQQEIPCLTKDGDTVLVKHGWLLQSGLYSAMIKDLFLGVADPKLDHLEFPVKTIPTDVFQRIVEWLKAHDGNPPFTIKEDPNTEQYEEWFAVTKFVEEKLNFKKRTDVIAAVDFLQVKSLYGYKELFDRPRIREQLGLEEDMTEAEKAQLDACAWFGL